MTPKPCPFCRGDSVPDTELLSEKCWVVTCGWCGVNGPDCETKAEAITAWNHRPGEEAVAEECARIAEGSWFGAVIAKEIRSRFGGKP